MTTQVGFMEAAPSSRPPRSAWRILLNAGAFLVAFAAFCTGVSMPVPLGDIPGPGFKYRYFSEHKEDYDLLFLGSSRVFHHFVPKQFDTRVEQLADTKVKSFNFGYDGMWPPESYFMLRAALDVRPPQLRWVLVDLMQINPRTELASGSTLRTAYWHDWAHTWMALRALKNDDILTIREKFDTLGEHVGHLFGQWVDRGRGADWMKKRLSVEDRRKTSAKKWEASEGFEVGKSEPMSPQEKDKFEKLIARYRAKERPIALTPEFDDAIHRVADMIRSKGAEPIFVLAPTVEPRENVVHLIKDLTVLSFADPDQYPDLYNPKYHYDSWHLNEQGAAVFTELLAKRFSDHLRTAVTPSGSGR